MAAADFNKYGFDLQFRMSEKATSRDVALGKIGIVFIRPENRKVTPIPTAFLTRVEQLSGTSSAPANC